MSLRWVSAALMFAAAIGARPMFGITVPREAIFVVAGTLALWNLITRRLGAATPGTSWPLFVELVVDLAGWGSFLYLTGGATNPMISLLLPIIAVGAAILPVRQAWMLAALSILVYAWLWSFHIPLQLPSSAHAALWHLAGMWATFTVSAIVIAWYVSRMTRAMRARDQALADAREQRLRGERVMALANLAAGAAHELGTPLGTMRLLVSELRRGTHPPDIQEDLALIDQQIEQCKSILGRLTEAAGRARASDIAARPINAWLDELLGRLQAQRPELHLVRRGEDVDASIAIDMAFTQAIHNVLTNALAVSRDAPVELDVCRRGALLDLCIADRGPGLPDDVRAAIDAPHLRERLPTEGLGIGLLLSVASIEHAGGSLHFSPRPGGGTIALITLPVARP
ncbi:HAMP domain-containing histidine kinase [Nitrogeniibacter mangrovi]|uniref:histidine kinase n=1 Tax=Nitrogeniibacter mangrovi TaxID=2016596 RepID=A0A6C1B6H2_9RHOO|nr:ATP-binding protein [Nitrogeniibacter mangrovi]QID19033.1 HAMP domain-containing histidine kinase [Nitrogeniibacter mangrovi]